MAETAKKIISKYSVVKDSDSIIEKIKGRQTAELIIALCGSVGSGTSTIASKIAEIFKEYDYSTDIIKISKLISNHIDSIKSELKEDEYLNEQYHPNINLNTKIENLDAADRIVLLQSAGNILRKKYSNNVLSQLAIKEIALKREREITKDENGNDERKTRRHVTIIDSLKNPSEVELLQLIYKEMFYLFGVLCPEDIRQTRLIEQKRIDPTKAIQLMIRDKSEGEKSGQQMLKTIFYSDFFISNSQENVDGIKPNLKRYIGIMMGDKSITPTIEENAMFHAQSAAIKSGCLSRQVGAAIIDKNGNIIATGCNDVPRAGGGLYTMENGDEDSRCMFKYGGMCKNKESKDEIFDDIDRIVKKNIKGESNSQSEEICKEIRAHARLNNLIEFCRAIHAEMDAITSVARNGGISLRGASLFSTTFPCHNCARHIIATGIGKVYYIEPYEKSLALKLHRDAISFDSSNTGDNVNKVQFMPFEGVSPRKYLNLFCAEERKQNGVRTGHDPRTAIPGLPALMETRYEYESKVMQHLESIGFSEKI